MEPDADQLREALYYAVTSTLEVPKDAFTDRPEFVFINANYLNGKFGDVSMFS
jgi:hypothetical protein